MLPLPYIKLNQLADNLSHGNSASFLSKVSGMDLQPTPVPQPLLSPLLDPQADWTSPCWSRLFSQCIQQPKNLSSSYEALLRLLCYLQCVGSFPADGALSVQVCSVPGRSGPCPSNGQILLGCLTEHADLPAPVRLVRTPNLEESPGWK